MIVKDYPWEAGYVGTSTTARFDGEKYRMWYACDDARVIGVAGWSTTTARPWYARESEDGINWTKPFLRQEEFEGSRENNLFSTNPGYANIDANPDAKESERFKGFRSMGRREKSAIYAMGSPDGINWRQLYEEPILTGWPFDTKNLFFWDEWTGQYRGYTRGIAGNDPSVDPASVDLESVRDQQGREFFGGVRWIRYSTSDDFRTWTPLRSIDTGGTPYEHLYTNECWAYERAPGTYLMFPSRYVAHRTPDPDWYDGPGVNDIVFMSSRDGVHWDRSFMEAFMRPGPDKRNWHERGIYFQHGIYQTSPTELTMYVTENIKTPGVHIRRYTLRPDGFVSVNAGYSGGELTTEPFIFEGDELELNYSTSAVGTMRVEIQDGNGQRHARDVRRRRGRSTTCPEMFASTTRSRGSYALPSGVRWDPVPTQQGGGRRLILRQRRPTPALRR